MPASAMIGSKHAQPAYQNRHLRPAQLEQLGAVDEQLLGRHAEANRKIVAETVGLRLQWLEAVRIGLFGGRIAPPGDEGQGEENGRTNGVTPATNAQTECHSLLEKKHLHSRTSHYK